MIPSFVPRTDAMTTHRRLRRLAAACAFAPGLFAGCANSSQFTAGRLPYGGAQTASAGGTPQDPFAAQGASGGSAQPPAGGQQAFDPAAFARTSAAQGVPPGQQPPASGFVAQGGQPSMGSAPHQTGYSQSPSGNPFSQASGEAPEFSDQTQWATFETPAAPPAESNPFAEIAGQPAVSRTTVAPAESLPTITPGGGSGGAWQPQGQVATTQATDEFLPPVQ